jgi:hypothetical protein
VLDRKDFCLFKELELFLREELQFPITLNFTGSSVTEDQLYRFVDLPLSGLRLKYCHKLTNDFWSLLKLFNRYHRLEILEVNISYYAYHKYNPDFHKVLEMPALKELNLGYDGYLEDEEIALLPLTLEKLGLSNNHCAQTLSYQRFAQMTSLKELELCNFEDVVDEDMIQLAPLKLEKLSLNSGCETLLSCMPFTGMTSLKKLRLSGSFDFEDEEIHRLPLNLEKLHLVVASFVRTLSCQRFGQMSRLKDLYIEEEILFVKESDLMLLPLTLEKFFLACHLKDSSEGYSEEFLDLGPLFCQHLNKMTSLKELHLDCNNSFSDADIQLFPLSLEKIFLSNSQVGPLSCRHFAQMSKLKKLILLGCENVTDKEIEELPLSLEWLEISDNPNITHRSCKRLSQMSAFRSKQIKKIDCEGLMGTCKFCK